MHAFYGLAFVCPHLQVYVSYVVASGRVQDYDRFPAPMFTRIPLLSEMPRIFSLMMTVTLQKFQRVLIRASWRQTQLVFPSLLHTELGAWRILGNNLDSTETVVIRPRGHNISRDSVLGTKLHAWLLNGVRTGSDGRN